MAEPYNPNTPMSAYTTAQARTEEQKKALLAAIAEQGTAGAQAYAQAGQAVDQTRQQALGTMVQPSASGNMAGGMAYGGPQFAQEQASILSAPSAQRQADIAQAAGVYGQDIARQQAAGQAYLDQVAAAVPIEEQTTRRIVEKIIREQQEAEQDRALQRELAQAQIQETQIRAQSAAADRDASRSRSSGGDSLSVSEQLALQEADEGQKQSVFGDVLATYDADDPDDQRSRNRGNAITKIINLGVPIEQAWTGLDGADKSAIRDAVTSYYNGIGDGGSNPFPAYDEAWHSRDNAIRQQNISSGRR